MAKLTLTIIRGNDEKGNKLNDISITTGADRVAGKLTYNTIYWERYVLGDGSWGDSQPAADVDFNLSMGSIRFDKKMYSPNEIVADIQVSAVCYSDNYERKAFIARNDLMDIFANRQVTMTCDGVDVCTDYYVHDIIPRRYRNEMYVTLKIYSPDKLMTLTPYSHMFVGKRLTDEILSKERENYMLPYSKDRRVAFDTSGMKFLKKDGKEHIFPYLVQYNESFYDFLARTTNRWGEFMYYENGKVNIGYPDPGKKENPEDTIKDYSLLTWHDLTAQQPKQEGAEPYVGEAPYDNNVLNSTVTKNKYDTVKNTIMNAADPETGMDVFWMTKAGQLLTTDKSAVKFAIDTNVDDWVAYGQAKARVDRNNNRIIDTYFKKSKDLGEDHFEGEKYNQFSEIKPIVDPKKYDTILQGEMRAGKNAIKVEYDTKWPSLQLGDIVYLEKRRYIIVEVEGYQPEIITNNGNNYYEHSYSTSEIRYRFTAIAEDEGVFYPAIIPAGHVRKAGSQVAVVVDVDDPARSNRVRVKYPWQLQSFIDKFDEKADDDKKIKRYEAIEEKHLKGYSDLDDASPWLFYAQPAGPKGAGVHGRHYLAEKVLIDYADGNVERPFVVGAVSKDIPASLKTGAVVLQAPNFESIKVHEGTGKGASAFISNLTPGIKLLNGFGIIPAFSKEWEHSELLEGGVDMGDRYGIWGIKCSTHDRNISIKSPWGDVKIDAFTGITISAPNGDVKIKGKNVSIEAGNNLSLVSGKNIKNRFFTTKDGWSGFGTEIATAVATKLASYALNFIDFGLLRTVTEVAFRPIEGVTTIKSNRFLKLEAGQGCAAYPNTAFKDKAAELAAARAARKAATNGIFWETNLMPDILKLFGKIRPFSERTGTNFVNAYNQACERKAAFMVKFSQLKEVSDKPEYAPCKTYEDLCNELFSSKDLVVYTADNVGFTNDVKIDDVTSVVRNGSRIEKLIVVLRIVRLRKERRNALLVALNEMSKSINKLVELSNQTLGEAKVKEVLEDPKGYGFSSNVLKKVVGAFPKDSLKQTFAMSNEMKRLTRKLTDNDAEKIKRVLSRKIGIEVIAALGFTDENRRKIGNAVPAKPTTDEQLFDNNIWSNYVASIDTLPKIADDTGKVMSELVKAVNATLDKDNLYKSVTQNDAWSDAKNGKILFSSGSGTFELADHIQKQIKQHAAGNLSWDDDADTTEKIGKLRTFLYAL